MSGWLAVLLQAALVLAAAPALSGLHRAGAPGQPYRDLLRLWRKDTVLPAGASFMFAAAPALSAAAAFAAATLVPAFTAGAALAPLADGVVVAGLLGLSVASLALAAWDAGSALAVHAAGRSLAAAAGPAAVLALVALAALLLGGSTNLDAASLAVRDGGTPARLAGGLLASALFGLALAPAPRPPALWTGRPLALAVLAGQLRRLAALSLAAAFCPFGLATGPEGWAVGLACWLLKLGVLGLLAAAAGSPRLALPAAALLAAMAVLVAGTGGAA